MRGSLLKVYVKVQCVKGAVLADQSGQDLIEYALVVALIALEATAGMGTVATAISTAFSNIVNRLSTYSS